jgi:prepilin-type N-terminal cleavage/methylation domain-containing protein
MQRNSVRQTGFSLLEMMIVLCISVVILMVIVPSFIRTAQVNNEQSAASVAQAIGSAELAYANQFHQFVPPQNLVGNLAIAPSCLNVFGLLQGSQTLSPTGYTMTWTPTGTANTTTCAGVNGYSGFQIVLNPKSKALAQKYFLYSSIDTTIHYSTSGPASITDPVYTSPTTATFGGGSGNGNGNGVGGGSVWGGNWNNSQSYLVGQIVVSPGSYNGATGNAGAYLSITANSGNYPPADPADWLYLPGGSAGYSPAPPPSLNSGSSGMGPIALGGCGTGGFNTGNITTYCAPLYQVTGLTSSSVSTYTKFSFTIPTTVSQTFYVAIGNSRSGGTAWCYMRGNQDTTCNNATQGGGSLTIGPGDQSSIYVGLQSQSDSGASFSWPNANWSLNP